MSDKQDNPPAFPRSGEGFGNPNYDTPGMTLRDWFAGQAAAACLVNATGITEDVAGKEFPLVARFSYMLADAMLAERAKP